MCEIRNSVLIIARARGYVKWFIHHFPGRFRDIWKGSGDGIETQRTERDWGLITKNTKDTKITKV